MELKSYLCMHILLKISDLMQELKDTHHIHGIGYGWQGLETNSHDLLFYFRLLALNPMGVLIFSHPCNRSVLCSHVIC